MGLGPFDLTGGPFLSLYLALLALTIVAGFAIPPWLRPQGRPRRVTDPDQLAVLAGSRTRFADTVVARLLASGALAMVGPSAFEARRRDLARTDAERGVVIIPAPIRWPTIERTLKARVGLIEARMAEAGLLLGEQARADLRFWATLPYALLIMFGATKVIIGDLRDRPIGILTALLVVTLVCALLRWFALDRRTRAGQAALRDAVASSTRLRIAPTAPEIPLAVALFGTGVLVGSGYDDFHKLRAASGDAGLGGGSDSGGDGGGGGGGGCGGCGS